MSLLRDINKEIKGRQTQVFNLKDYWRDTIEFIKNVCFLGEIEKEYLYLSMLHQMQDCETGTVINLTFEEANEFCLNGRIEHLKTCKPYAWTFWQINLRTRFIRVNTSFTGQHLRGPKDNFIISQEAIHIVPGQQMHWAAKYVNLRPEDRVAFRDLIEIVNYSRDNVVDTANFNRKVFHNFTEYWGLINNVLLDDIHKNTMRHEVLKVPIKHDPVRIQNDKEMVNMIRGTSFMNVNFTAPNAQIRKFKKIKDLNDYYNSLINYINKNNKEFLISQKIDMLEKYYESNRWPAPQDQDEIKKNRDLYTRYELAATKFDDKVALRIDVQEFGICYYLTNYNFSDNPWVQDPGRNF